MLKPALALLLLAIGVLGFFRIFGDCVWSCRAETSSVHFRFLRFIPLWKIPYSEIADVRPVPLHSLFTLKPFRFYFISRPGAQLILIKRNRGFVRNVLITPVTPDQFVTTVRAAIRK